MLQKILRFDRKTLKEIERIDHPLLEKILNSYTALGSVYLTVLFLGVAWSLGMKAHIQKISVGLIAMWTLVYGLKHLFSRKRPSESPQAFVTHSFPSGHSATAFFLAVTLSSIIPLSALLYVLAAVVAFSRIYLDLHYPSDALAGSSIGLLGGYLTLVLV